jgi:hypothetical protein
MRIAPIAVLLLSAAWLPAVFAADPPPAPVIAPATAGDAKAPKDDAARMEVSGKIQLDMIYDFKKVDPQWNSTLRPSTIPINCPGTLGPDPGCGKDGETIFSVRQTAIAFKGFVPTQAGQLKTDLSLDLFNPSDGGNTRFRLLHAWAELGAFGVGQYETLFMNLDLFPNTLDYWGPSGMIFVRNPQVRYTPYKTDKAKFAVSLEAPNAAIDTGKLPLADLGVNVTGWTKYPDIVAKYSMNGGWGFFDLGGIVRSVGYKTTTSPDGNPSGSKTGWGVTADGALMLFGKDRVVTQVTYGEGVASYFNDGGNDLAPVGGIGQGAELVKSIGMMLYYDHQWSGMWASSIGYSQHHQDNTGGQASNAFKTGSYASTNLLWTPAKNVMWGAEFLWGKKEQKDGQSASDTRVQFTGQFKF